MFSSVSANTVEFVCAGVVLVAALTARRSSRLRMFFAAFRQMLSIYWSAGNHNKSKKWADSCRYQQGSGAGVRVLWCSGTRLGSEALKRGFSVLVTGYSDEVWCWVLGRGSEKAGRRIVHPSPHGAGPEPDQTTPNTSHNLQSLRVP